MKELRRKELEMDHNHPKRSANRYYDDDGSERS